MVKRFFQKFEPPVARTHYPHHPEPVSKGLYTNKKMSLIFYWAPYPEMPTLDHPPPSSTYLINDPSAQLPGLARAPGATH